MQYHKVKYNTKLNFAIIIFNPRIKIAELKHIITNMESKIKTCQLQAIQ